MNRSFGGRGKSPRGGRGKSPGGRGRSPGGRGSFGGGGRGKFRGGGGHQSGDRKSFDNKSPYRGGQSPGNRGRGGQSRSPHGRSPHHQMTPKMNGKSPSPFSKSADRQVAKFNKGKSPGTTPKGKTGPPKSKKSMGLKPSGDDDPDDMDEDELNRLLNESDDGDEDDEFDFDDDSSDDEGSDEEDSDSPGLTIEEVTDDAKTGKMSSKKTKTSEDSQIETLMKKIQAQKKGKKEEDEDLDISGEDEDDEDEDDDEDDEDEEEAEEEIKKLLQKMKAKSPGKSAVDDDEDEDDEDEDDDEDDEDEDDDEDDEDEDDDEDDEDEDDDEDDEDEDDDEDDDDDEEIQKLLKKMKAESSGNKKAKISQEDNEDDDEDEESDEEVEKLLKKMKQQAEGKLSKKVVGKADVEESDDDEDDDDDDEDDEEINKLLKAMRQEADKKQDPQKRGQKRKAEDDDDDSDNEDWKPPKTKLAGAGLKRPAPQDSSEEDESEDEDEGKSKPTAKKPKMVDDEEDEDDESDDLEIELLAKKMKERQAMQAKTSKKRAAPDDDEEFEKLSSKTDKQKKAVVSQVQDDDSDDSEEEKPTAKKSTSVPSTGSELKPGPLSERRYLQPTPKVQDPKLRKELFKKINDRLQNTLRVRPVPSLARGEELLTLCPAASAVRIPWNKMTRRSRRVAFLEFKDKETTEACMQKLKGTVYQKRKLMIDVQRGIEFDDIDDFNARRLLVSNLSWNIDKGTLISHFPKAEHVDIMTGGTQDKRMPGVAFITFKNERDAINAFDKTQGTDIKGRRVSVAFQRKPYNFDHNDHLELVVFGIKKSVREQDLAAIFTRGKSIDFQGRGMASISYATHADCAADFKDRKGVKIGGKSLVITYGSRKNMKAGAETSTSPVKEVKKADIQVKSPDDGLDRKSIFVRGLDRQTQVSDLKSLFPKAVDIFLPMKGKTCRGSATIKFSTEDLAAVALKKAANSEVHGRKLIATFYRKMTAPKAGQKQEKQPQKASQPAKGKPVEEAMDVDKEDSSPADQSGKKKKNKNKFKGQHNEGEAAKKPVHQKQQHQQQTQGQKKKFKGPKPKKAKAS